MEMKTAVTIIKEFHEANIPLPDDMKTYIGKVLAREKTTVLERIESWKNSGYTDAKSWQKVYKELARIESYERRVKK